jgi:hypothetical protein
MPRGILTFFSFEGPPQYFELILTFFSFKGPLSILTLFDLFLNIQTMLIIFFSINKK